MTLFLAFLGVSFIVIATPGPDTAITIRNSLLGGRAAGLMTALGIACGQAIWALATSAGVVTLLTASEPVFMAVKYAGAAYLVFLGIQALREALWPRASEHGDAVPQAHTRLSAFSAFRQGIISDLGNPKMAVFFASLLPQFVPASGATFSALLFLGIVFSVLTFVWLAFYATLIAKAGDFLRRPKVRRAIEGVTGMLLIGLGVRIAAEHR